MGGLDKGTFKKIMAALASMYPKFELTQETLTGYYAILHDLDADLLKAATIEYGSKDTPWPPSAGQLRQLAFDLVDRAHGRIGPYEAWGRVVKAVRRCGIYEGQPEFDEPAIARAIAGVGGWRAICMAPEASIMSTRARFIEAFQRARNDERTETRMLPQIRELAAQLSAGDRPRLAAKGE